MFLKHISSMYSGDHLISKFSDERANAIGRLASAVAHLYLTSKNERSVEVDIGVKEMKKSETVNNSSATVELKKSVS